MSIRLFRVDERLIHGQVTVGWGMRLRPDRYLVVDDRLAGSEWEQEILRLGAEAAAEFLTVSEARELLASWQEADAVSVLLTRDLDHMLRLARGGRLQGLEVNLGGIHHAPGREQVLPFVFLDDADRDRLRALVEEGASVSAQELPSSQRTSASRLLE